MAVTIGSVLLDADSGRNFGTGAYTTGASSAPTNGNLLVACVSYVTNGGGDPGVDITISDSQSHTWTPVAQVRRVGSGSDYMGAACFVAQNSSTSTFTVQVDTSAGNIYGWEVFVFEASGHDTGSPVGGKGTVNNTGNGGVSLTLDAAPTTDDLTIGFLAAYEANFPADITPGTGFTQLVESGTQYPNQMAEYRASSTSTTVDWLDNGASVTGYIGIGFVVKATGGGSTPKSDSDAGTGTETQSIVVTITQTDSGTGTDVVLSLDAALGDSDTGSGSDGQQLDEGSTDKTGTDTGTWADAWTLAVAFTQTETGSGTDAVVSVALLGTDTGTASETSSSTADLNQSDSGHGADGGTVDDGEDDEQVASGDQWAWLEMWSVRAASGALTRLGVYTSKVRPVRLGVKSRLRLRR